MESWAVGQRCLSLGEPALGLGTIKKITGRTMEVGFAAAGIQRTYSLQDPPLHRVAFHPGDCLSDRNHHNLQVKEVREQNGILIYLGDQGILPETELSDSISATHPEQVLLAAQLQTPRSYAVRRDAHRIREASLASPLRGMVGARIELVPHQLFIAARVGRRHQPRVLLADEVGLGKTVEAGLIFHQQWVTGSARRVLVLTPDALVVQWLAELYRKFNHLFHIMDSETFVGLQESSDLNPYESHQRFLQGINSLLRGENMVDRLLQTQWDMIIVDEAHHLEWSEEEGPSDAYALVEKLARRTQSLILISATPRQLGLESHFALLRLLDANRFADLDDFLTETGSLGVVAQLVENLHRLPFPQWIRQLEEVLPNEELLRLARADAHGSAEQRAELERALIDRHGTGRVVYRNRREVLQNLLPKRVVHPVPLPLQTAGESFLQAFTRGAAFTLAQDALAGPPAIPLAQAARLGLSKRILDEAWAQDPRLPWLIDWLRQHPGEKVVLICSSSAVALAIQETLFPFRDLPSAVFHEQMSLLERDRQAAWFASNEGAQILLCSEIGSEGRNFQFAHHLILFDLPFDPGLLEQRIGRLDRIGQHQEIHLHIPYAARTLHERLFTWYRQGLGAFDQPLRCADQLASYLDEELQALLSDEDLPPLIEQTRISIAELTELLEKGRDLLLERHSFDPTVAQQLIQEIQNDQVQNNLPHFMERLFEILGLQCSQLAEGIHLVAPGHHMFIESYPGIPAEGLPFTYQRELAVAREDLAFFTMDHPVVTHGLDLMLSQDRGVASVGLWKKAPEPGLLLQLLFLLECPGKDFLPVQRFLPPTPIEILIDQNLHFRDDLAEVLENIVLDKGQASLVRSQRQALEAITSRLLPRARDRARAQADHLVETAKNQASSVLHAESNRLQALASINPNVRPTEISYWQDLDVLVQEQLQTANLRLDALRLILMKP